MRQRRALGDREAAALVYICLCIQKRQRAPRRSEIAAFAGVTSATASNWVSKMHHMGLVRRAHDAYRTITVTPAGADFAAPILERALAAKQKAA